MTDMGQLGPRIRVCAVQPTQKYRVLFTFDNGVRREIDLEPFLRGPIFEPIRHDRAVFRSARVEGGTIAWDNGADIDPDVLYYNLKPAWMEELEIQQGSAA
jgi:Protein of unknown function (DUF2442)